MADRISVLQDELLCQILSFLETENAVATSILSKRWRHLWRSVPALDFRIDTEDFDKDDCYFFKEFVYSVLLLRDAATPVKKFHLLFQFVTHLDFEAIDIWVNFVTRCRVEHLHLHVTTHLDSPQLPISILSCRTLVVLKLYGFIIDRISSIGFPTLKILDLKTVTFTSGKLFMEFLAGCPILEDLVTYDIRFFNRESSYCGELAHLSLPNLTKASIVGCWRYVPLKPFCNVKFLGIKIEQVHQDIPSFHNMTHLELDIELDKSQLLAEMLNHCPKLQSLSLKRVGPRPWADRESVPEENWVDPEFVPECLSTNLKTCSVRHFQGLQVEFQLARYILKNARVLQTMTILTSYDTISQTKQIKMIRKKLSFGQMSPSRCQLIVHEMYSMYRWD